MTSKEVPRTPRPGPRHAYGARRHHHAHKAHPILTTRTRRTPSSSPSPGTTTHAARTRRRTRRLTRPHSGTRLRRTHPRTGSLDAASNDDHALPPAYDRAHHAHEHATPSPGNTTTSRPAAHTDTHTRTRPSSGPPLDTALNALHAHDSYAPPSPGDAPSRPRTEHSTSAAPLGLFVRPLPLIIIRRTSSRSPRSPPSDFAFQRPRSPRTHNSRARRASPAQRTSSLLAAFDDQLTPTRTDQPVFPGPDSRAPPAFNTPDRRPTPDSTRPTAPLQAPDSEFD